MPARGGASPARKVAYAVVRRVSEGAYADRVLRAEAGRARLGRSDRAFAQQLTYGTVQRRLTLDHVIAAVSARPLAEIDPPVLDALRLGVYQLLWMGSVPDHAAVDETVELAKSAGGSGYRFANAVMRRAGREGRTLLDGLGDATPAEAAIRHSHPEWVVAMWWDTLGPEQARALMRFNNEPAESAVRANTLRTTREELI